MSLEQPIWNSNTYNHEGSGRLRNPIDMLRKATILCIMLIATLFLDVAHAQEKSAGATFSYAGTGVEYIRYKDSRHFSQYQLRVETSGIFWSGRGNPGISASAFWNIVIAERQSRNDNTVRIYAGPGISAGYGGDTKNHPSGIFFGLKGRVGAECSFPRKVTVSLSVSPMLGGHFSMRDGMVNMRLYRTGLCYALMPEAAIRYNF